MLILKSKILAQEPDEESRYRIVQQQRSRTWEEGCPVLFEALGDQSWRVRKQSVEQLLASGRLGDQELELLVGLLRDEDNAGLRNSAAELLIRLGQQSVPALLASLHDQDHDLRKQVVDILGAVGGQEALQGLLEMLADPDCNVAAAAAEAIGTSGDATCVADLVRYLDQSSDQFFRYNLLAALGKIGLPGPLPSVIRQLVPDLLLSRAVYECLGRIGGDLDAVELLLGGIASHQPSLQQAALSSLAAVLQQLPGTQQPAAVQRLRDALDSGLLEQIMVSFAAGGGKAQAAIIDLLGYLHDPRSVPLLFKALADERLAAQAARILTNLGDVAVSGAINCFDQADDEAERAVICQFIGARAGQAGLTVIKRSLDDSCAAVRAAAATALANMPVDDQALSRLAALVSDDSFLVRDAALSALVTVSGSSTAIPTTVAGELVRSSEPEQRCRAAQLFAALKDHEQLAQLIKDEEPHVREAAARAAGKIGGIEGCRHLVLALSDEVADVRIAAAEALGDCHDMAAIEPLRVSLQDRDPWVQAAVLKSLVQLAGQNCVADIVLLWEKGDEVVQLVCLDAFRQLGTPACLLAVSRNLGSRSGEVLKGAIELLHSCDPSLLVPWLNHIICHPDWDVRITAVRASDQLVREHENLFRIALDCEQDGLVRAEISALLSRI